MEAGALFALFAVLGITAIAYSIMSAAKRRDSAAALATRLGMSYHATDDLGIARLPHPIFRLGDRRKASNLVAGSMRGRHVVLFDYEHTVDRTDPEGKRSSSTYSFSGVEVDLDIQCPSTVIRRERVTTKLANALGVGGDVQFESDAFNRAFEVRSSSQQFAFTLVDPAMMQWLMTNAADLDIQFEPGSLVVITKRRQWTEMESLAARVLDFTERFPRLVWSSYGTDGS
ncbi:MAG TPA: DUF3137 domain-containing protein [Acidimicrobiia bacterium]